MECLYALPLWAKITGAVFVVVIVKKWFGEKKREVKINKKDWKKDIVYLFQFPRSPSIPNVSPFCLKLETWLRLTGIKYETILSMTKRSVEGTMPFVELNGEQYHDSAFIIDKLTKYFDKSQLEDDLNDEQKGLGRLIEQTTESSIVQSYSYSRIIDHGKEFFSKPVTGMNLPSFLVYFLLWRFQKMVMSRLKAGGIGRHSRDEIIQIGKNDLKALSNILGTKKFFLGDNPHKVHRRWREIYCTCFTLTSITGRCDSVWSLAQIIYLPIHIPHQKFITQECQNLKEFCDRIKEKLWPDWENLEK